VLVAAGTAVVDAVIFVSRGRHDLVRLVVPRRRQALRRARAGGRTPPARL